MSFEPTVIDRARAYAQAHEAYVTSSKGRAERLASQAFKRAYVGCAASDDAKLKAITDLGAAVLQKFQNSYIFKHQQDLLTVEDKGVTLEAFVAAARSFGRALEIVQITPELRN